MECIGIYNKDKLFYVNGFLLSKYPKDRLRDMKKLLAKTLGEINKNLKEK